MNLSGNRGMSRNTVSEVRPAAAPKMSKAEAEKEMSKILRESSEKMMSLVNLLKDIHLGNETSIQRLAPELLRLAQELADNDVHIVNVIRTFMYSVWQETNENSSDSSTLMCRVPETGTSVTTFTLVPLI